jgi:hypothetical protein
VSELGDVLASLALDKEAGSGPPAEGGGESIPPEQPAVVSNDADAAAAVSDELARLALAQPAVAAGSPIADSAAPAVQPAKAAGAELPGREDASGGAPLQEPSAVPAGRQRPSRQSAAQDTAAAPVVGPAGRRRSGRLSAAADQENRSSADSSGPAAEDSGDAVVKAERRSFGAAVQQASPQATAAEPAKAAAKRVAAMRQFWEATAQKEGRPRAGAQGLPHKNRGQGSQPVVSSVQDWSDDD